MCPVRARSQIKIPHKSGHRCKTRSKPSDINLKKPINPKEIEGVKVENEPDNPAILNKIKAIEHQVNHQ